MSLDGTTPGGGGSGGKDGRKSKDGEAGGSRSGGKGYTPPQPVVLIERGEERVISDDVSEVCRGLYLGNEKASSNRKRLDALQIQTVVNVTSCE